MNKNPYNDSITLLAKRDYSEFKLKEKLSQRGYAPEEIDETISKLLEQNYLRPQEYRRIRIKVLLQRGHGENYIKQKLKEEHLEIEDDDIAAVKAEFNISPENQIAELIEKKLRHQTIPTDKHERYLLKAKITRYLHNKGHQLSEIQHVLDQYL